MMYVHMYHDEDVHTCTSCSSSNLLNYMLHVTSIFFSSKQTPPPGVGGLMNLAVVASLAEFVDGGTTFVQVL